MMDQTVDSNNNDPVSNKYSLRPRTASKNTQVAVDSVGTRRKFYPKPKKETPPLSKYRRRSANARERSRMREINEAFETLRRVVSGSALDHHGEKMTKILILRLAMKYISALSSALQRDPVKDIQEVESHFSNSSASGILPLDSNKGMYPSNRLHLRSHHRSCENFSSQTTQEPNTHLPFLTTCERPADQLRPNPANSTFNEYYRTEDSTPTQILVDPSCLTGLSHCDGFSFSDSGLFDSYSVPEQSFQEESSTPLSQFDNFQPLLVSNTQSAPLQGILLEKYLISR